MLLAGPQGTMKMEASSDIFWAAAGERKSIYSGAGELVYEYGLDALEAQRTVALAERRVAREGIYRFCAAYFVSRQEGGDDASRLSLLLRSGCAQEEHHRLWA